MLASCTSMVDGNTVRANQVGVASQALPATVISAKNVTIETTGTARNIGTGVGAAVGAGAGQLLGGGSGRIASTVGFGVLGALAGRYMTDAAGNTAGQTLTVLIDGTKNTTYTVTQPVSKQTGYIPVGTHGMFYLGGNSRFEPDGNF